MPNYKVVDADKLDADLGSVADAIRVRTGKEGFLRFPDGFAATIKTARALIETAATDNIANHVLLPVEFSLVVAYERIPPNYFYNGVELPEIPLFSTDTKWVILYDPGGRYILLGSATPWYFYSTDAYPSSINNDGPNCRRYKLSDDGKSWVLAESAYNDYWVVNTSGAGFQLHWANHDIPDGSATAAEIYFEGSDPVPIKE